MNGEIKLKFGHKVRIWFVEFISGMWSISSLSWNQDPELGSELQSLQLKVLNPAQFKVRRVCRTDSEISLKKLSRYFFCNLVIIFYYFVRRAWYTLRIQIPLYFWMWYVCNVLQSYRSAINRTDVKTTGLRKGLQIYMCKCMYCISQINAYIYNLQSAYISFLSVSGSIPLN